MMMMNRVRSEAAFRKPALLSLLMLLSVPAWALQSVSDDDLSGVSAQAGIDLSLINPNTSGAISTTVLQSIEGSSSSSSLSTLEGQGFTLNGIGTGGVSVGAGGVSSQGAYNMKTSLDVGSTGTTPTLGIGFFWGKNYGSTFAADSISTSTNAMRMQVNSLDLLNNAGTQSVSNNYGALAFDSSGSLRISNLNGLFSNTGEQATDQRILRLTLGSPQFNVLTSSAVASYGQLYYRQAPTTSSYNSTSSSETSSELVFDHMYLDTGFTPGVGGVVSTCLATSGTSTARCGGSTLYGSAPTAYPTAAGSSSYSGWFNGFSDNNNGGIYIGSSHLDFNFSYDVSYRSCSAGSPCTGIFTTANNVSPIGHLGWSGGFNYAELMLGTGGMWTNVTSYNPDDPSDQITTDCTPACTGTAARTNGINIGFHGNYDSNFTWVVGDAPGAGSAGGRDLSFGSWTTLPGAAWSLNAPNITIGTMDASQGPGGLCWGAQAYGTTGSCTGSSTKWANNAQSAAHPGTFLNLPPTNTNLGLVVRDLSLQAYSSVVQTLDDKNNNGSFGDSGETNSYSWGLIYTLGQFDQNMYIYPGNGDTVTTTANGITLDWLLMSQSFGTYPVFKALGSAATTNALLGNTNFMIADTSYTADGTAACGGVSTGTCAFGIGLVQANLLVGAHRMNISLQPAGLELKSSDVRFEMEGLLAGGPVPNLQYQYLQKLFYVDENFEATQFDMVLIPAVSGGSTAYPYLGFTNRVTLGDTTLAGSTIGVPESSLGANGCQGLNPTSGVDCNYVSLAEPSSPTTDFRVADISGDMNVINGVFGLFSAADTQDSPDGKPKLVIAATVQIGATVSSGTTAPLTGIVKLGGTTLGNIVIPSGQAYGYMALKPQ